MEVLIRGTRNLSTADELKRIFLKDQTKDYENGFVLIANILVFLIFKFKVEGQPGSGHFMTQTNTFYCLKGDM